MATRRNASRPGRPAAPAGQAAVPAAASPAIEPLGRVRRSQLISTYGIGAIVDLDKGSFMPMGLEDLERPSQGPALRIGEARLQALLGVDHFRLPPVAEDVPGVPGRVSPWHCVPAVRFPEWHECPKCHRIGRLNDPFQLAADGSRLECTAHGGRGVATTPVRFVVACRKGHIDDFPWAWWAHRRRQEGTCNAPRLELRSRGKSAALADLQVRCLNCGAEQSLGDAFLKESVGKTCHGRRPWLVDRQQCDEVPRVIQRGASNVHFAAIASALSIPPVSEVAFQIVDQYWAGISGMSAEALPTFLRSIGASYGVGAEALMAAVTERRRIESGASVGGEAGARREEYVALCADRDDPMTGGVVPHFRNEVSDPPPALARWLDLVGAVSRLREVRALAGFTRIEPFPVSAEQIRAELQQGNLASLSKGHVNWLPAAEIRGEGIFLRFRTEAVDEWIAANPGAVQRAAQLDRKSAAIAQERGYTRDEEITARSLLVHSFAHALVRTISIDCGYSSSALRERLYVAEPSETGEAMNGVLIYTGSPDSEGSLGGLVRLAQPDQIERIVMRALRSARWCGSDPVCLETDPRQSGDRVSGAACHCCLLVPETACEKFNRELDRTMLVGSAPGDPGQSWSGFFGEIPD